MSRPKPKPSPVHQQRIHTLSQIAKASDPNANKVVRIAKDSQGHVVGYDKNGDVVIIYSGGHSLTAMQSYLQRVRQAAPPSGGGGSGGSTSGDSRTSGGSTSGKAAIAPKPTHDTSYTPDSAYAQQVMQQLANLKASMSQEDFAHLMQTQGLASGPVGANGVLDQQVSTGTGQMGWPQPSSLPFQMPQQTIQPKPGDIVTAPGAAPFREGSNLSYQVGADGSIHLIVPGITGFGAFRGAQSLPQATQTAIKQPVTTPTIVGGPSVTNASGGVMATPLSQDQQSAIAVMDAILDQAGLSSLRDQVLKLVQEGYTDPTVLSYMLQQTPEYQRRFAGNDDRIKNGLGALSPGEYLATERAYQDVLRSAGLPAGFYDSPDDFASWISADVSPQEVQQRVNDALHFAQSTDPTYRTALAAYYGIDDGHIAAYFLDNKRAMPLLQKQANAADIGAAALWQGLDLTNLNDALIYADNGVTSAQARQGYSQIAGFLPEEQRIAAQFGQSPYTQTMAEHEIFGQDANAARQRRRLNDQESALFGGSAGLGRYALGMSDQGAF